MADIHDWSIAGSAGALAARTWSATAAPEFVALISHGYGEHLGRYDRLAAALVDDGGVIYAVDHRGHGRSEGERVAVDDYEQVVSDLHLIGLRARAEHPDLPVVLIGHSMGGMIAARYAQRYTETLDLVVLASAVIGRWQMLTDILALDELPDDAIDPSMLSRDPAVGADYANDPLVWHGAFKRPTLEAAQRMIDTIADGPRLGSLPLVWIHGDDDRLVPLEGTRVGIDELRGETLVARSYRGARHELFNEINAREVTTDLLDDIRRVLS